MPRRPVQRETADTSAPDRDPPPASPFAARAVPPAAAPAPAAPATPRQPPHLGLRADQDGFGAIRVTTNLPEALRAEPAWAVNSASATEGCQLPTARQARRRRVKSA